MFNTWSHITKEEKGGLTICWLAATLSTKRFHRKFKSSTINNISVSQLCDTIKNIVETNNGGINGKCSLHLSSQLMYGTQKILSYQTSNLEKQIIETTKNMLSAPKAKVHKLRDKKKNYEKVVDPLNVLSTSSAHLDKDLNLLCDEPNIENKYRNIMDARLDFGVLTEAEINFFDSNIADIPTELFERMNIRETNMNKPLDMSFDIEKNLSGIEESDIDNENQKRMSIYPTHDIPVTDQEHQVTFANTIIPEIITEECEPKKHGLLTPQKRKPDKEKETETPSKKTRLRFEDAPHSDKVVTALISETEVASVYATAHPPEMLQDIESVHEDSLQIASKSRKKKVFADKNKQLSHKTIKKWLNNVNAHTVPLSIINVNMPMSKVLFKAPSTCFTSIHKNNWNKSLSALFDVHTITVSEKNITQTDYGHLLEKSTEFTRFDDKSDITKYQLSHLSSDKKTLESSSKYLSEAGITKLESSDIIHNEQHEIKTIDSLRDVLPDDIVTDINQLNSEQNLELLDVEQSAHPDFKTHESTTEKYAGLLTKQDLLALLEIQWRDAELVRFTDVIQPGYYNDVDAASCFLLFLELHKEEKITLEQAEPYDVLWIRKYVA